MACAHCEQPLEVPAAAAGTPFPCPNCGVEITLEPAPASADVEPEKPPIQEILNGFQGRIAPPPFSPLYHVGLWFTAGLMVLLPIIYLAIAILLGWGVWQYAGSFSWWRSLPLRGIYGTLLIALAYVTPLAAGATVVLFMFKPFFARRVKKAAPLAVNPGAEPELYAFIAKICQTLRAPMPVRIDLDCHLNAMASFNHGLSGLIKGELVLTLGMPLVAGLTVEQLAGVIAHEFGHFTQGGAMRVYYFIEAVNLWLARAAYERDAWDESLAEIFNEAENGWLKLAFGCVLLAVGFSRMVLSGLMYLGAAASSFLSRQMEYNADFYEIQLAGSLQFETTMKRLHELSFVTYQARKILLDNPRKLTANFPQFVAALDQSLTPESRERIAATFDLAPAHFFDTHPSTGDRIRQAAKIGAPGVFFCALPATVLWQNFNIPAQQVSASHYMDDLNLPIELSDLEIN